MEVKSKSMKKIVLLIFVIFAGVCFGFIKKDRLTVTSPDGQVGYKVSVNEKLQYAVTFKGKQIVSPSDISLILSDRVLGVKPRIKNTTLSSHRDVIALPYGGSRSLDDEYNELVLEFEGGYSLIVRAYNDGVAYRFKTDIDSEITVVNEEATFRLSNDMSVIFPESENFTSWEVPYVRYKAIDSIAEGKKALTPVVFSQNKLSVVIAESDVLDYPGMYLLKQGGTMKGTWAAYPKRTELGSWGNFVSVVKERENFIARTPGKRTFPWRVIIPTDDDKTLIGNKLVYKLAKPLAIDASWVKPGKATWEWWHDAIVTDAEIPSGMDNRNTALYKHYIDFAAANGLEYLMLDAGWSNIFDLSKVNPKVDVHELVRHGKSKGVDIFLWCVATAIIDDLDRNMALLQSWGVAGVKVDFIDRDDQQAITWFEKIAASAAGHHLMVNFHGCSKPTGLERAYPNIVNYEAVRGAECSKWDFTANPDHHLIIPFTRMIAGPLDYTPGSMRNSTKADFKPVDPGLPSTQGTRCHELAMYVLYDQPFAMLCDAPAEYRKYPDIMKYLSAVPTSFDETKVLQGKLAEYAVVAKRKDRSWFVGAMTNWNSREVELDFSFLPAGASFQAELYTDGANANKDAGAYDHKIISVNNKTRLTVKLSNGGGAVAYIHQ